MAAARSDMRIQRATSFACFGDGDYAAERTLAKRCTTNITNAGKSHDLSWNSME